MADREIATAADYADAMLTARRAKHFMVLLLLLMLLAQFVFFFVLRFTDVLPMPTSTTAVATTQPGSDLGGKALYYLSQLALFSGVGLSIALSLVLLLIVNIMLVGRLIGVGRLTSAYITSLLLLVLLFPWQAFLNNIEFKVPGVLYTWDEVTDIKQGAKFSGADASWAALKWTRYVGMPAVAMIMLLVIQVKSNRGMRQALGEDDLGGVTEPSV